MVCKTQQGPCDMAIEMKDEINEKTHVIIPIEEYEKLIDIDKCDCKCDLCMYCDGNCKCSEVVCICKK